MKLPKIPKALLELPNPPKQLFYKGNIDLLKNKKIAIVGTRAPNQYTKALMPLLVKHLSKYATIISGGAIGVDKLAHINSFPNTIMAVSYTHLTLPTIQRSCRSRWSPYH